MTSKGKIHKILGLDKYFFDKYSDLVLFLTGTL